MEKIEAIREWCVEQAVAVVASRHFDHTIPKTAEVIETAKEIEDYITSETKRT